MLVGHLLCKAKLIKNFETVPLADAIKNQFKDKFMWGVAAVFGGFDGLKEYRDAKSINRQQLDLIRENHAFRADLDHANVTINQLSGELETVTNHATKLAAPTASDAAQQAAATNHTAKVEAPAATHTEQAALDKAASTQAEHAV